ncbi:unnamed protein product [Fraxinus pennsylvanica]|uniref:Uncharacterized protein n=1 Tax=Fraxinus pennsylvanica TaxID=56036 RepID=A0AAD1YQF5_9LAMI|nr:unnamed protein product [Fraxinus pennsylvanica]
MNPKNSSSTSGSFVSVAITSTDSGLKMIFFPDIFHLVTLEFIEITVPKAFLVIVLQVLIMYGLEKLFGSEVGLFLTGWFGVVFEDDIMKVSNELAIGLSIGFLGSLTTFSGWNQKMLDLSHEGR